MKSRLFIFALAGLLLGLVAAYRRDRGRVPIPGPGRMGRIGARWSLSGAEAILRLRALRTSGDFDDYWSFHLAKEHERTHASRYADGEHPQPASCLAPAPHTGEVIGTLLVECVAKKPHPFQLLR
jgi:hypothetical protein